MTSSGLEWDPLDFPLVGLPSGCKSSFPKDRDNPDLLRCQIHSLWSVSSTTGCGTSSRTGGSGKCTLRQEEEEQEGRRQRRAGKEPGGSGRVKEVRQTFSYCASGNLSPPSFLPLKKCRSPNASAAAAAAALGSLLIWPGMIPPPPSSSRFSSFSHGNCCLLLFQHSQT